jgi:hypothetical protein
MRVIIHFQGEVYSIILMMFFWLLNTFMLSVEFPQKITPYNMMEWK